MREEHLILHFDTAPGRYPDTIVAAKALIEWSELIQATLLAIDPSDRVALEIAGVEKGSTRFPNVLRFLNDQAANVKEAWVEYPHLKAIVAGAAHTFYTSIVAAGVTLALAPDEQTVRLSDDDRALLKRYEETARQSEAVREANKKLYSTVQPDTAIEGIGAGTGWTRNENLLIVPRSEFAERSGLWEPDFDEPEQKRPRADVWDVVLLKAPFSSEPKSWRFARDGLPFTATMKDPQFLQAIAERRVPISLQEGVSMRVEIQYSERLVGQVWETIPRSRKITRVLSPSPLPEPPPNTPR